MCIIYVRDSRTGDWIDFGGMAHVDLIYHRCSYASSGAREEVTGEGY